MPEFYHARSPMPSQEGKPHIFLATPAINIAGSHFASMIKALPRVVGSGVAIDHFLLMNGCHVDDMRNICVAQFLKTDCTHLLFVDADIGFTPEGLYRMCEHEGEIVAGVYPRKEMALSYPLTLEAETVTANADGLITEGVASVPAGFLRISRRVLEHMSELRLGRTFRSGEGGEAVPIIFERGLKNGNRLSGDVAFCHWARELGYAIAVDPLQHFIHEGSARFAGCLAADLGANQEGQAHGVQ